MTSLFYSNPGKSSGPATYMYMLGIKSPYPVLGAHIVENIGDPLLIILNPPSLIQYKWLCFLNIYICLNTVMPVWLNNPGNGT